MSYVLVELLSEYLRNEVDISAIDEWVAVNVWQLEDPEEKDFVDQISVELAYLSDGVSEEAYFKSRVADIVSSTPPVKR